LDNSRYEAAGCSANQSENCSLGAVQGGSEADLPGEVKDCRMSRSCEPGWETENAAVEIAYNECAELMSRLIEEPKRRAEAAMQRSKALRENLRSGSELEDDPSS
jgi:hypothetical protein